MSNIREADIDPTFVQRYEADVVIERVTKYNEGVIWPTDEIVQRMWALSMATQVLTRELFLSKNGEEKDVLQMHLECAERIREYVNNGNNE